MKAGNSQSLLEILLFHTAMYQYFRAKGDKMWFNNDDSPIIEKWDGDG